MEELRFIETKQVDLTTASKAYFVYELRGGETILIKAKSTNTGLVYLGKRDVSTSTGYSLAKGEAVEIVYAPDKPYEWKIELYAVAATAGDDVEYIVFPAP